MKQKPFTAAQKKKLLANAEQSRETGHSARPVVKFFCPWGAATWLISDIEPFGDNDYSMFGLCDLGHGFPELGSVLLSDLQNLRGPLGMTIERDLHFTADKSLTAYADEAREKGRIVA